MRVGTVAMNVKQIRARVKRLEEFSMGLASEDLFWRKSPVPVMHSEVALYLNAIYRARHDLRRSKHARESLRTPGAG